MGTSSLLGGFSLLPSGCDLTKALCFTYESQKYLHGPGVHFLRVEMNLLRVFSVYIALNEFIYTESLFL